MIRKITAAIALLFTLASLTAGALEYLPDSDGSYSISYKASAYGDYVITAIKGLYETESEALDALYDAQDEDIVFYDAQTADEEGNVSFEKIVPISYTDASVFLSGSGFDVPVLIGEMLSDGNVDIAKAVFVGIEESYTVNGKYSDTITERVSVYTIDSFGYPTLSNPSLSLSLENADEYVSLSSDGTLTISPFAENKEYVLKASLEDAFSDTFAFSVTREKPRTYEISLYRPDAHDRPMKNASLVGVEGVFPTFEVFAQSTDQFGNIIDDKYTFFVNDTEYPDGFTPDTTGEYTVYVVSENYPDIKASVAVTVTDRPEYEGNAALLFDTLLEALFEVDRIDYNVFLSAESGRDIYPDKLWTTENALNTLKTAIDSANSALSKYSSGTLSDSNYLSSYNALSNAVSAYRATLKSGVRIDAQQIILSAEHINLAYGRTAPLSATLYPENNTDVVSWSVSDSSIVSFGDGAVKALGTGTAYVTATTRTGLKATCEIYLYKRFTTVSMYFAQQEMLLGEEDVYVECEAIPQNGGDRLLWTSSDESVASVDQNGHITAYKDGRTTITVTSLYGLTSSCVLIVKLPADTVTLDVEQTLNLKTDERLTVNAYAARLDGKTPASTSVTFTLIDSVPQHSGDSVISLGSNGYIRALKGGTATVRIQAEKAIGKVYKDIQINVFSPSTSISLSEPRKTMAVGSALSLFATLFPNDATDSVSWHSTRETIASVSENGIVTAHAVGTARIYAVSDSGVSKYCTVSVGLGADSIKLLSDVTSINVGEIAVLRAKAVRKDGKRCIDSGVTYSITSGRNNISIDSYGVVTGIKNGTSTVRIAADTGETNVYTDVVINVCEKITELSFAEKTHEMYTGEIFDFSALITALPETHSDLISWESSDERYLTVAENGEATALRTGTARLYAYGGSVKTFITVNIQAAAQTAELSIPQSHILTFGESHVLGVSLKDEDGNSLLSGVTWESSDTDILSVAADGTVTAGTKAGTATITVRANAGNASDSITLTVVPSLYDVGLINSSVCLEIGQSLDVMTLLTFSDADGNDVDSTLCSLSLRSRDENIALTDKNEVLAVSEGTISVRIIVYCGNVSRSVNLRISVSPAEQTGELSEEENQTQSTQESEEPVPEEETDAEINSDIQAEPENGTESTPETEDVTPDKSQEEAPETDAEITPETVPENEETPSEENTDGITEETMPENDAETEEETTSEENVSESQTEAISEEETPSNEQTSAEEQTLPENSDEQTSVTDSPETVEQSQ